MDDPILLNQTYTILCSSTYFKKVRRKRKLTCLSIFSKEREEIGMYMTKSFKGVVWLHTKYRPLFLLPQLFKNAPKMHQCRVCRAGQVRTSKRACGHAGVRRGRADGLTGLPAGRRANGQFLRGARPTGSFYDVSLREAISL